MMAAIRSFDGDVPSRPRNEVPAGNVGVYRGGIIVLHSAQLGASIFRGDLGDAHRRHDRAYIDEQEGAPAEAESRFQIDCP